MRFVAFAFAGLGIALLSACASKGPQEPPPEVSSAATRAWLQNFGAQYQYDTEYLEQLLQISPSAYEAFAAAMGMADQQVHLPRDAHYVALIAALLADDCGACTQLNLRIAAEAGVDRAILRQVLEDPASLEGPLKLVYDYAAQVVRGENADAVRVAELRRIYGDAAFGELAVNVLGARIYPALRRALSAERACPPPTLDF